MRILSKAFDMLIEMIIIIIKQVKQFFKIKNSGSKKLLKSINL